MQSIPAEHVRTHKLASIVLEYRRECHSTDIVESLTSSKADIRRQKCGDGDSNERRDQSGGVPSRCCEYTHLLRTQEGGNQEILRGRTTWRARSAGDVVSAAS